MVNPLYTRFGQWYNPSQTATFSAVCATNFYIGGTAWTANGVSKILAGTNITISPTAGVGIVSISSAAGGGGGSVSSAANLITTGSGTAGIFAQIAGTQFQFKDLFAGPNIALTESASGISISAAVLTAQNVLYVSKNFPTSQYPFFNTISAAYAALNGTTTADIIVFPGRYIEAINTVQNVSLIGVDRDQCIIDSQGGTTLEVIVTTGFNGFYNLYIDSTGGGGGATAMEWRFQGASNHPVGRIYNCIVGKSQPTVAGVRLWQLEPGSNIDMQIDLSYLASSNAVNAGAIQTPNGLNGFGGTFKIRRCTIVGTVTMYGNASSQILFENCRFQASMYTGFNSDVFIFQNCSILSSTWSGGNGNNGFFYFHNCDMLDQFFVQQGNNSNTVTFELDNCVAMFSNTDQNFIQMNGGAGVVRLWNCIINGGKINFTTNPTTTISLLNTLIKNPSGTYCIADNGNAVSVFAGNLTSDKLPSSGVSFSTGSFNYNLGVGI